MCDWLNEYWLLVAAWLLVTFPLLMVSGFVVWAIVRISDNERAFTGDQIDGGGR
jgi:hypothetical protein